MLITPEIISTMNYVHESSYRTQISHEPKVCHYPFQRDKEYFSLDYSDIKPQSCVLEDEEF